MPRRSSARVEIRTGIRAERFLCTVKEHAHRHAKSLPLQGGERARQRKLDPDDTLAMSVHEATAVLAHFPDDIAADLARALLHDAGKGGRVTVALSCSVFLAVDIAVIEKDAAILFSRFLADADDVINDRAPVSARMRLEWQGVAARAERLMEYGQGREDG